LTREAYIRRQRTEHGRRAVAVLPIHYPKELLTALELLAVAEALARPVRVLPEPQLTGALGAALAVAPG
jgi:hypothetical protein